MLPTISVITPSFNQGKFLEETILSVIGQEGEFYLDYTIVDGGSTDSSVDIIRKYDTLIREGRYPIRCRDIRYRWVSEKDAGQAHAINKGFEMADGTILAWLNSDDVYLDRTLKKVVDTFEQNTGPDVVYGKAHFIDSAGGIIGKYPTGPFTYRMMAAFNYVCQPSVFFRKEVLDKTGPLNQELKFVMDYDLWIRMAVHFNFTYLPEFLSSYRLHEESKTISEAVAFSNHEECLKTVMRYYNWAPFNRVYGYCYHMIKYRMPLIRPRFVLVLLTLFFSAAKYLQINKGIRLDDLRMINSGNVKKLSKDWIDIFKDY
jgi:glycosyltransferase involved in cell wall biosynthesis